MFLSLIAAADEQGVIGDHGKIPWHLPADFAHFKVVTTGHPVIMGRKTFESIGKPLPGRTNIVVTRDRGYAAEGCLMADSLERALELAEQAQESFVIGGGELYRIAMPHATRVYLTRVHGEFAGDTYFPAMDEKEWELVSSEPHGKDEKNPHAYTFLTYERK